MLVYDKIYEERGKKSLFQRKKFAHLGLSLATPGNTKFSEKQR